jgi:mono/diheme cytochrome c family protein
MKVFSRQPIIVGVLLLAGCRMSSEPSIVATRPTNSADLVATISADPNLRAGQAVYNLRCAHCHGNSGEGQVGISLAAAQENGLHIVPPHDSTGHTWQHPSQLIRQVILDGIQNPLDQFPMPPFQGVVTDTEIEQLIAYMSLWWTDEQRAWQAQVTQRRAELDAEYGIEDG